MYRIIKIVKDKITGENKTEEIHNRMLKIIISDAVLSP